MVWCKYWDLKRGEVVKILETMSGYRRFRRDRIMRVGEWS